MKQQKHVNLHSILMNVNRSQDKEKGAERREEEYLLQMLQRNPERRNVSQREPLLVGQHEKSPEEEIVEEKSEFLPWVGALRSRNDPMWDFAD